MRLDAGSINEKDLELEWCNPAGIGALARLGRGHATSYPSKKPPCPILRKVNAGYHLADRFRSRGKSIC
jgi:hypothetical protein